MIPARGHGMHQVAQAGSVRGIYGNRQTGQLIVEGRHPTQVQGIARIFIGAQDSPLTQDNVFLAQGHHPLDPQEIGFHVQ